MIGSQDICVFWSVHEQNGEHLPALVVLLPPELSESDITKPVNRQQMKGSGFLQFSLCRLYEGSGNISINEIYWNWEEPWPHSGFCWRATRSVWLRTWHCGSGGDRSGWFYRRQLLECTLLPCQKQREKVCDNAVREEAGRLRTEELYTQQKEKRDWPPGERVQLIQQRHGCLYQSGNCHYVTRLCEQQHKHTCGVQMSQKWSQILFTALNTPEVWGSIYSMWVTDLSGEILYFSYCQQIPRKDRKTAINWSD